MWKYNQKAINISMKSKRRELKMQLLFFPDLLQLKKYSNLLQIYKYLKLAYFLNIPVWAVSGYLKMQFQSFPGTETQSVNPYERLHRIWKINKLA